jgi:hypothetical protein
MLKSIILNTIMLETMTLPRNLTLIPELLTTANDFTGNLLGVAILIIVGFGSLFLTSSYNTSDGLITSSFITMIVSIFLYFLGLLNDYYAWIMVIVFIITIIISKSKSTPGG